MDFQVIWEHDGDDVLMVGKFDGRRMLGILTREAVEDDTDPPQAGLTLHQRKLIAESNIAMLSRHLHRQADGGMANMGPIAIIPRITIRTGDLRSAGTLLSTNILKLGSHTWVDPMTGQF